MSVSLSGKQQANVNTETRQSILSSVNLGQGADEASDKNAYVEQEFNKYITDSYLVDAQGNKVEGDAFSLALTAGLKSQYDIMKQANPDVSKLTLPVFVCSAPWTTAARSRSSPSTEPVCGVLSGAMSPSRMTTTPSTEPHSSTRARLPVWAPR